MNLEEFKKVQNFSRYLISPSGVVFDTLMNTVRNPIENEGVIVIASCVKDTGCKQSINVRREVYKAFVDSELKQTTQVRNIDGNIWNNHFTNIEPVIRASGKRRTGFMDLSLNEDSNRRGISKTAKSIWKSMHNRCNNPNAEAYSRYGAVGVTICDEWNSFDSFFSWFKDNYIEGFALDKDFVVAGNKVYSPNTCVFIPTMLNSLLAHPETPVVEEYKRGTYTLRCYIACKYVVFKGLSEEDCLEQYHLTRQLQLEKLVFLMNQYHNSLKLKYPTTPQIDGRVINKLQTLIL